MMDISHVTKLDLVVTLMYAEPTHVFSIAQLWNLHCIFVTTAKIKKNVSSDEQ